MSAGTKLMGWTIPRRWIVPSVLISLAAGLGLLVPAQAALAASQGPAIFATVTPAGPGPIVSGYHKTACVDDSADSAANDTPVVIGDCNGSAEQQWTIDADGTIETNGKCMDVYRDQKTSKSMVEMWTCTGGANQQWEASSGTLVNPESGKCLDDPRYNTTPGVQLELYTCNSGANQQWILPS
jgi:hypothetical protein